MNKRYKTIRKVIITGPMSERNEAFDWAWENGYEVTVSGPMPIRGRPGYVDVERFKIVAQKQIASSAEH